MSLSKILSIGLGLAALGAGIYVLSQDSAETKLDPSVHTLEKLEDVIETVYLEYACGYIYYYNIIQNMKNEGRLDDNLALSVKAQFENYTKSRDEMVAKKYKISSVLLEKWINKYSKESSIAKVLRDIQQLDEQVFVNHKVEQLDFDIPQELTREVYVQVIRKVLACIRREIYSKIQAKIKSEGKYQLSEKEVEEIEDSITEEDQDVWRKKALKLFGIELPPNEVGKKYMQRAYLKYYTIPAAKDPVGASLKTRWYEQVQSEQKIHTDLLKKVLAGERIDGIEHDPLESAETDYKMDMSVIPGYMKREESISGTDKLKIEPMAESLKYVNKMLEKGRKIRESHHHGESEVHVDGEEDKIVEEANEEGSRRQSFDAGQPKEQEQEQAVAEQKPDENQESEEEFEKSKEEKELA